MPTTSLVALVATLFLSLTTQIYSVNGLTARERGVPIEPYTPEEALKARQAHRERRIVGGVNGKPRAWQVSIGYIDAIGRWTHYCGGSVIDTVENWILTAAHCIDLDYILYDKVRMGGFDLADQETFMQFDIYEVQVHEAYDQDKNHPHDIALLKISGMAPTARHIKLNSPEMYAEFEEPGRLLEVTGWGALHPTSPHPSRFLMEVSVPAVENPICNNTYHTITHRQLCAGYPEGLKDSCFGDSGGPLVAEREIEPRQVGLVSFGYSCAEPNEPGVYTRVSQYLDWIQKHGVKIDASPRFGTTPTIDSTTDSTTETETITNAEVSTIEIVETPTTTKSVPTFSIGAPPGPPNFRKDLKCGPKAPLPNGEPAECNPKSVDYCCSPEGNCGNSTQHCESPGSINYRTGETVAPSPTLVIGPPPTLKPYRRDGKCGPKNPLPGGKPAQCDPASPKFCCSPQGECGGTPTHCSQVGSINHRTQQTITQIPTATKKPPTTTTTPTTTTQKPKPSISIATRPAVPRADRRCGPSYLGSDGKPGICDGNSPDKHCCTPTGWCSSGFFACSSPKSRDFRPLDKRKMWREDGRCGYLYRLADGRTAQCDPVSDKPCCSGGRCTANTAACDTPFSVNFKSRMGLVVKWRRDGRCGPRFPLPNKEPAECNPDPEGKGWCCSNSGTCGKTTADCTGPGAVDYRQIYKDKFITLA